jgi:hypothetical protein
MDNAKVSMHAMSVCGAIHGVPVVDDEKFAMRGTRSYERYPSAFETLYGRLVLVVGGEAGFRLSRAPRGSPELSQ